MKGPGNTNGVSNTAGDGRHTGKVLQHHAMRILTSWDLPGWPRTQLFPVTPDSHCTVFLSHTQDMDLAHCTCENCIYFVFTSVLFAY